MNENDEKLTGTEGKETDPSDFDLLNEVKELKKNSVSKEEYDRVVAEKKKLMRDFVYGSGDSANVEDTSPSIQDLREKLFGGNVEQMSNRDFWENVSQLYHKRLEEDKQNIFLPKGHKTRYKREDYEMVSSMMETIDSMLEDTKDNPALFTSLFNEALN